jgi:recombination protein RecA
MQPEDTTPGGRALRFYSSVRLGMQRLRLVKDTFGTAGAKVKLTSVKNKVAPPLRARELHLVYGRGFVPGETMAESSTSR